MKPYSSIEDKKATIEYLLELGKKALALGNPECAIKYFGESLSNLFSFIRSSPRIQPEFQGLPEKILDAGSQAGSKFFESRKNIARIPNNTNENTNVKLDLECAEFYKRIALRYNKEAENKYGKHFTKAMVNAHITQLTILKNILPTIQDKTVADKIKKEIIETVKLYFSI